MKTSKMKKIMVWILAALMMLSVFGGTALAEEEQGGGYTPVNTYVLNYSNVNDIQGYEDWDDERLYFSPFRTNVYLEYNEETGGYDDHFSWCSASVLNMIDVSKIGTVDNAGYPYASIPAYCVDAIISRVADHDYARVNLEDCTYFDDTVAGRVRAIITNSFPCIEDMQVITDAVNSWIDENQLGEKFAYVQQLHYYEVISATSTVIWSLTNKGMLPDNICSQYGYYAPSDAVAENPVTIYDCDADVNYKTDYSKNNINAVARYLEALAPMAPSATLISDTSFENLNATKVQNLDGTFTLTVSVKVVVDANATSNLKLTLVLDDKVYEEIGNITATGEYTFVIPGIADNAAVKLAIDGVQSAGDVYLFNPVGGREASQTMAGYDTSEKPVHAEIVVEHEEHIDNAISISKITTTTEKNAEGEAVTVEHPLEGIVFDIYYVSDVATYNAELLNADGSLNVEALNARKKKAVAVMTTDKDGKAFCDVTLACKLAGIENADGVYQVVERSHPAIEAPAEPVLVFLPYTTEVEGGQTTVYTAELKLNNTVKPAPEVSKDVAWIENNRLSVNAGAAHTWIIRGEVPADMANAKKYVITDTLDYRLSYIPDSLVVKAGVAGGAVGTESLTLAEGTHYTMSAEVFTNNQGHGIDYLEVSLTEAGMQAVGALLSDGQAYEVRVYFNAKIDANGAINTEIPNQADLTYTNSVGFAHDTKYSDIPVVYTRGLRIYKYDAANTDLGLAGAMFKVARIATDAEINAGSSHPLVMRDGQTAQVIYETFYTVPDWTAEGAAKVDHVVTGEGGLAMVYGLAEGTYYLVEVRAPGGYNLMSHPKEAPIDSDSDQENGGTGVPNSRQFELPATGGIGTLIFTVGGGLLIVVAVVVLLKNKKVEDEDEEE